MEPTRITVVAIDFDGTLAYFKEGKHGLFRIFAERGVDRAVVEQCYEETKREVGFSIAAMCSFVSRRTGRSFVSKDVQRDFDEWLKASLARYDDVIATLQSWRHEGRHVVILTAGDADYQRDKIRTSGVPFDDVEVVPDEPQKATVLRELVEEYGAPVLLIEDRPLVLDLVRDSGLDEDDVITVRLKRRQSPYFLDESRYEHKLASNLWEVRDLFVEAPRSNAPLFSR